jgi:hypothetical protein
MTESLTTTASPQTTAPPAELLVPRNLPIVAIAREDFAPAQQRLRAILEQKRAEQYALAEDLQQNLDIAIRNKWRHSGLLRALRAAQKTEQYYINAREAVAAGYMLVPNLDCDVYAVRQGENGTIPRPLEGRWHPGIPLVNAERALPSGEGDYVSDLPEVIQNTRQTTDSKGEPVTLHVVEPVDTRAPEAPLILARPVLMEAAGRAMALRLFDEIGIVGATRRQRKADPMLVGRILHPVKRDQHLTFFIAWWIDPRSI